MEQFHIESPTLEERYALSMTYLLGAFGNLRVSELDQGRILLHRSYNQHAFSPYVPMEVRVNYITAAFRNLRITESQQRLVRPYRNQRHVFQTYQCIEDRVNDLSVAFASMGISELKETEGFNEPMDVDTP